LTGQAGAGKTTILYTIAKKVDSGGTKTVLGGNFFCSRQFSETRESNRILPTVVYQLAQICKPFGDALYAARIARTYPNPFAAVSMDVEEQIRCLLLVPWQQSEAKRAETRTQYLIIIDALDEMEEQGASVFLQHLFSTMSTNKLVGLKFLVASRTDQRIQNHIQSFGPRKELWLQHVLADEASSDVRKYLDSHLSNLGADNINKIQERAQGLFIYAATVVRFVQPPGSHLAVAEKISLLCKLLAYTTDIGLPDSGLLIDTLYQQIMVDAFSRLPNDILKHRLKILHFFLSTATRESPSTIAAIVGDADDSITQLVVDSLHAVIYLQKDGRIFWYHTSFPDFIFDSTRSRFSHVQPDSTTISEYDFSCNQRLQHDLLLQSCFNILQSHLKFNYAGIKSSFSLDEDTYEIHPALEYAALHWADYLTEGSDVHGTVTYVSNFLELQALFWIEVTNLMKKVKKCSSILDRVLKWASDVSITRIFSNAAFCSSYWGSLVCWH
jgi:hypothetical protein